MKAVLLCAGFGTRLHPLTRDVPKPLLPVAGKPMVEYLVDQLAADSALQSVAGGLSGRVDERHQEPVHPRARTRGGELRAASSADGELPFLTVRHAVAGRKLQPFRTIDRNPTKARRRPQPGQIQPRNRRRSSSATHETWLA